MKALSVISVTFKEMITKFHIKSKFIKTVKNRGVLLDAGCGNSSPYRTKRMRPDIYYVGVDVGDYNQAAPNLADEYAVSLPDEFHDTILNLGQRFDAVISSHNIEHCCDRQKTLDALIKVLKPGGKLYLSFPSEASVTFPTRKGTLNYYDDKTHTGVPPKFDDVIEKLKAQTMEISFACKSYKPFFLYFIGFLLEPLSKITKKCLIGRATWAYYGFESVIIAVKR